MGHQSSESSPGQAPEIEELVRQFEACTLPLASFNHHAHLTVTLFYLTELPLTEATERMRRQLHRLLAHYGAMGYNETITLFWLRLVDCFLKNSAAPRTRSEQRRELIANYGDSRLIYEYYSRQLLMSDEAKAAWTPPDVKELDF